MGDLVNTDGENVEKTSIIDIEKLNHQLTGDTNQCHLNITNDHNTKNYIVNNSDNGDTQWNGYNNNNNNNNNSNNDENEKNDRKVNENKTKQNKVKSVLYRVAIIAVGLLLSVCVILVWYYMGSIYGIQALVIAIISFIIVTGKWRWFYVAARTIGRDTRALFAYIKIVLYTKRHAKQNSTIGELFLEQVKKHPQKRCIINDGKAWTFKEINEFSNQIGNYFKNQEYRKDKVIALYMENCAEFVAIWLGLSKLGIIIPLINTNQRNKSLTHSINIANADAVIFGDTLKGNIDEIIDEMPEKIKFYQYSPTNGNNETTGRYTNLNEGLKRESKEEVKNLDKVDHHDKLLYIYTSGTTGLPKAAVLSHARFVFIAAGIHYIGSFEDDDIFYTPLPLYHTAGGVMSIGQAILFGSTVVIRKKFSASGFFPDCEKYNCTVAQYIGEMCRYMLATPPSASDKNHKLRMIFGNGLRPQIWEPFVDRFKIKNVTEFYGATEGNANIVNITNQVGAVGFISRIIPQIYPISIIRADPLTGEPIRDKNGLCQVCKANEPGVFVGKIIPGNASRQFLGYVDRQASEKKIVRDVFKKGDSAFLSGDILITDEFGNLYFKDRTGDTFRWKGENVSTSEVEAYVSNEAGYRDTVVYGVEIPNVEGRAGMAAILDPDQKIDLVQFANGIKKSLPPYGRPLFIRLLIKVDLTGTFKLRKLDLQQEGFDPSKIDDRIYYLSSAGNYDILTSDIYKKICSGQIRF